MAVFQAVAADFLVPAGSAVAEVDKAAADFRAVAVDSAAVDSAAVDSAAVDSAAVVVDKAAVDKAVLFKVVAEIVDNRPYCKIGSAYTLYCIV